MNGCSLKRVGLNNHYTRKPLCCDKTIAPETLPQEEHKSRISANKAKEYLNEGVP